MSIIREAIERYSADRKELGDCLPNAYSRDHVARFKALNESWSMEAEGLQEVALSEDDQADLLLFRKHLKAAKRQGQEWARQVESLYRLLPFLPAALQLPDDLNKMSFLDAESAAKGLTELADSVDALVPTLEIHSEGFGLWSGRMTEVLNALADGMQKWYAFYHSYDPLFDWWTAEPKQRYDRAIERLKSRVDEIVADPVYGEVRAGVPPVGAEALAAELREESISYTPEELIEIAEAHYRYCEQEMQRAAAELGFEDWREALEKVKDQYVPPGGQHRVVLGLIREAIEFVESRDLLTIDPIAKETIQMRMMSAEAQRVNPFFLGGPLIIVSYPTSTMSHAEKLMSMRGNNPAFSRATVQHELIPGHHMQWHAANRYKIYREPFWTPFWVEGWTLHWEMLLWDLGFPRTPEERIGMLFWRMHRCVRVVFSLGYHLGRLSPQDCVDMLVSRVGHERANAEGEVRRSFGGNYGPLYQLAYLIGGLMVRSMYVDWSASGRSPREFHDRFLGQNNVNLGLLRAALFDKRIHPDSDLAWDFAHSLPSSDASSRMESTIRQESVINR